MNQNTSSPARSTNRSNGFTLVELLVVIAIIVLLAGLLVPTVGIALDKANQATCLNNLKEIYKLSSTYATSHRSNYPYPKGKTKAFAYECFQVLADSYPGDIKPKIFLSEVGTGDIAEVDDEGMYTLDETTCNYTYREKRTKSTIRGSNAFSSNEFINDGDLGHDGHKNGMNVVYCDGEGKFVEIADLPEGGDLSKGRALPKGLIGNR